jgi:general secretion pathway protein G
MIEVIFVIVIIGILAAIGIPKLAATRSDAQGAKVVHSLSVCINDAASYYMIHGQFGGITNGAIQTTSCRDADECFDFTEQDDNGSITVGDDAVNDSKLCHEAQIIAGRNLLSGSHTINF